MILEISIDPFTMIAVAKWEHGHERTNKLRKNDLPRWYVNVNGEQLAQKMIRS